MQKAAVSLAYDGGCESHLSFVVPALREAGFKATFYLEPPRLLAKVRGWRQAARDGHEVANGSLLSAALPDGSLPAFRIEAILEDVSACEELLDEVIGATPRSVALPIGRDWCADGEYASRLLERYSPVRTGRFGVNSLLQSPSEGLLTISCRGVRVEQIVDAVREAMRLPAWLILSIGDVGSNGMSREDHADLIRYLVESREMLDVGPVVQIFSRRKVVARTAAHLS